MDNIKHLSINWHNDCENDAEIEIHVDANYEDQPHTNENYEQRGNLYFQDNPNGLVHFFYYDSPGKGYSGRTFPIVLKDGTPVELKGPWSGSNEAMNIAGFPLSTAVVIHYNDYKCGIASDIRNDVLITLLEKFMFVLNYYVCLDGTVFVPKNQLSNTGYVGSYAQIRQTAKPEKYVVAKFDGTPKERHYI